MLLRDYCTLHDLSASTVMSRIYQGMSIEEAVTIPIKSYSAPRKRLPIFEKGTTFGRWTILEGPMKHGGQSAYLCKCDCGTIRKVVGYSLYNKISTSCGCLRAEINRERMKYTRPTNIVKEFTWNDLSLVKKMNKNVFIFLSS